MLCLPRAATVRDVLLVSVGAFSAFSLVLLSKVASDTHAHLISTPVSISPEDAGYYSDWSEKYNNPPEDGVMRTESGTQDVLPRTRVLNHAPGWTMFENLYMSNGTLFVVLGAEDEENGLDRGMVKDGWENGFPLRRMMTSTGLYGYATAESIAAREPTDKEMSFISAEDATRRWGDRVWEIEGHTVSYILNMDAASSHGCLSGCITTPISF
jgi:hypothetical protein